MDIIATRNDYGQVTTTKVYFFVTYVLPLWRTLIYLYFTSHINHMT
jgi:hypothetical protein